MSSFDLFKLICELKQSNPSIWEDISVVQCTNNNVDRFKTNKTMIYQTWPFLAEVLGYCDLVIIAAESIDPQSNESSIEENVPPLSPFVPKGETQQNICDQCGKSFVSAGKLKRHRVNAHQDLACSLCDKSFGSPGALKRHKEKHSKDPLKCEICGKVINYSSHYDRHLQTHFSLIKYDCSKCPMKFGTRQGLQQHEQTHQIGSFKCHLCNKSFNVKRYLSQHSKKCIKEP